MNSLRLYFFGPPRFVQDGQVIKLTNAKAIALLAYLALGRHRQQLREQLIDLLWPHSLPDAARKNMRNTLWAIGKAFGNQLLSADSDWLVLNEQVWIDLWEWERLRSLGTLEAQEAAVASYHGALLDGLSLIDAPDLELWLTTERLRLEQRQLALLEALAGAYRRKNDWERVRTFARFALDLEPLQEPIHRLLMEASARMGLRAEALRQYDRLYDILEKELSVTPLPQTNALRDAIANGQLEMVELTAETRHEQATSHKARATSHEPPSIIPFVGREAEQALLDEEFERAAKGQVRVVLLKGELGVGKTRLWQEWVSRLPDKQIIVESRCLDTMQSLPFAPLMELFRKHGCMKHLFAPTSALAPVWLAQIARLLPEIRTAFPDLPTPNQPSLPPEEERHHLFEAFRQSLRSLNAKPIVLFIDDIHWGDQATLDWLIYLVHYSQTEPLLLVMAYRPQDAPPSLVQMIGNWARQNVIRHLPLHPLSDSEAASLISSQGVADSKLIERVSKESGGNPYFLLELLQAPPGQTPKALTDLVRTRLEQLPDGTRQVLQAAAILVPDFSFSTLRRTSGRGEEETLDALDTLLERHLLIESNERYSFAHPVVATVMRKGLSQARRRFLHRRAGEVRERIAQLPEQAGQLATHFAKANAASKAAHYAQLAAEHALTLAAPAEAVAFYQQALALEVTAERQMGLGRALEWQGELIAAQTLFEQARQRFEAQNNLLAAAQACLKLAESFLSAGRADEVLQAAQRSLSYLDSQREPSLQASTHFLLGTGHLETGGSLREAESHLRQAIELAKANHNLKIAAASQLALGNLLAEQGELSQARDSYDESIKLSEQSQDYFQKTLAHNNAAYHAYLAHDLASAEQHLTKAFKLTESYALRIPCQYLYSTRGELALAQEEWHEAINWFERGLKEAQAHNNLKQIANYYANLALAARGKGNHQRALTLMLQAHQQIKPLTAPHLQAQINLWLTELYLKNNAPQAAKIALTDAETILANSTRKQLQAWAKRLREEAG